MTLTERVIAHLPSQLCVTTCYLRDGIVLEELQGQKCQQCLCQNTDVVQTGQVGWMELNQQWQMVKYIGRSASPNVITLASIQNKSQWKTVDPTLSTNWVHLRFVILGTVAQTKHELDK